jgi:hypothetical protein
MVRFSRPLRRAVVAAGERPLRLRRLAGRSPARDAGGLRASAHSLHLHSGSGGRSRLQRHRDERRRSVASQRPGTFRIRPATLAPVSGSGGSIRGAMKPPQERGRVDLSERSLDLARKSPLGHARLLRPVPPRLSPLTRLRFWLPLAISWAQIHFWVSSFTGSAD